MKDNIQFINDMQYPDFQKTVTQFFDEHMMLYNLVGNCSLVQNIDGILEGSTISFKLDFKSEEDAKKMNDILQNMIPFIFGRYYQLIVDMGGTSLIIHFI